MDESEYKLMTYTYSDDEKERIKEYNSNRLRKALELLTYNRDKLLNDKEYSSLAIHERVKSVQSNEDFKEFCFEFPAASKYMVAYGLFSSKAFLKYLEWKARIRPSDNIRSTLAGNQREQEKFKNKYIYSVYMKYLYADKHPKASLKEINTVYKSTYEQLNAETDSFFDMYENAKKDVESKEKENEEYRKKKILEQISNKIALEKM
jgi:hypothetical protein